LFLDMSKYRVVDLSPEVVAQVTTETGEVWEGKADPLRQGIKAVQHTAQVPDFTRLTMMTIHAHVGSHVEGGKGHIDHFPGYENQTGLWEMPLTQFFGEAAVLDFSSLKAREKQGEDDDSYRGHPITPEHLSSVRKDDIVLMWSSNPYDEAPIITPEAAEYLRDKGIKGLAVQVPGIKFDGADAVTHKILMSKGITISYPLAHMEELKKDRVFYFQLPMRFVNIEASWVRAVAFEEI